MSAPAAPALVPALVLGPDAVPVLPRGVRLHGDRVRQVTVLLAPERALMLDAAGEAILRAVDGRRTLGAIAADLAARFGAAEATVLADAADYLGQLALRRIVEFRLPADARP